MKAVLEFTLPDEDYAYRLAILAPEVLATIQEFMSWLRSQRKYASIGKGELVFADKAWAELHRSIEIHHLEEWV